MKVSIILPYFNRLPYLHATLTTLNHFHQGWERLEIVVVDDGSAPDQRAEKLKSWFPKLNLRVINLDPKIGSNPCLPYNVGVRHSTGEVLLLSSPETLHTQSIFGYNFHHLGERDYFCFSVFCPTDLEFNEIVLNTIAGFRMDKIRTEAERLSGTPGFGENGRDKFNNGHGSWYLHSKYRPSHLNFCTAIRRSFYDELSGFDERFRNGSGYDDQEFVDRLIKKVDKITYYDSFIGLHLNHPPVYGKGDPISNLGLYERIKNDPSLHYASNSTWGKN